ncbi:transcriptional antitermination N peptide [Pantoea anthophila]
MTIVMTILASDNARNRRRAKRAADREQVAGPKHISRIEKACSSPSLRDRHESTSVCLPSVAIFQVGHRKTEAVTAR